jgi:phosphoadenosine phosphosulfate reductase
MCYKNHTTLINPIIDWDTDEVWEFLKEYNIPYCSLYDEGFKRLGCIGCPMGSREQRLREFERWPKYKNLYMVAFQKMIENRGGCCVIQQADRRGCNERLPFGELEGRPRDFTDMTPEEIIDWWID